MIDLNEKTEQLSHKPIQLIKWLRKETGLGLAEAKNIVDQAILIKNKDYSINVNYLVPGNEVSSNEYKFKRPDLTGEGFIDVVYNNNRSKIIKYQQEIWHTGLSEHKIISAPDESMLLNKIRMQYDKWDAAWKLQEEKKNKIAEQTSNSENAELRSMVAQKQIYDLEEILHSSLEWDSRLDWETLKNSDAFVNKKPTAPSYPTLFELVEKPSKNNPIYQPKLPALVGLLKSKREKAQHEADAIYLKHVHEWEESNDLLKAENERLLEDYNEEIKTYHDDLEKWEDSMTRFYKKQKEYNHKIDDLKNKFETLDAEAIRVYLEAVLNNSPLPIPFTKEFEVDYISDTKILIVDYMIPNMDHFPRLKEVKYNASKNEFKESYYTDSQTEKLYDSTIYRFILRILHELFEADTVDALEAVFLNIWVNFINRANGNPESACISSIQVKKEEFLKIDLRHVDPKTCFKSLKGVGSSKLAGVTPIQPILTINKEDKRFISSYDVAYTLDESKNLAAMDWEDFEHLIRELFQKEFSVNGGEVKVTQASKDGGVDAVVFDPDPIRGGKIIIQAKRYSNTVGVSAVRDLFGTVMNEGAMLGILVTTADYGPDAYNFASNKPLRLLNGGNLLSLLEKHGHQAKIDLKEAKMINNSNRKG